MPLAQQPLDSARNDMSLCWTFLSLPKEIRLMILNMCIGNDTFHIMQNGSSMWNQLHTNVCKGPTGCHLHQCSETLVCAGCNKTRLPGISATCRTLDREVSQLLYSRTLLSFMSSEGFFNFVEPRLTHRHMVNFFLSYPRRIELSLGQGQYSSASNQAQNCKALRLLAEEACELRELHVQFQYSPRAAESKWPVTVAIMESLCKFR